MEIKEETLHLDFYSQDTTITFLLYFSSNIARIVSHTIDHSRNLESQSIVTTTTGRYRWTGRNHGWLTEGLRRWT